MVDKTLLTNNLIPYGLLKEHQPEIAKALKQCGGPWELYFKGEWTKINRVNWDDDSTYRLVPQPRECWRNEYPGGKLSMSIYLSKEDADKNAANSRVRAVLFREVIEK